MIRRLFMLVLMACLAMPAVAAPLHCAPAPVEASAHHGHHGEPEERQTPTKQLQHDCIGCIAPFLAAGFPARAAFAPVPRQQPLDDLLLARLTAGPDTPPPRT